MQPSQSVKGLPEADRGQRGAGWVEQGLLRLFQECSHCRECGALVSPFEKVCAHCGASDPVVVSTKSFLLPLAIAAVALGVLILVL